MRTMRPEDEERFQRIERLMEFLAANQAQVSASNQINSEQIAEHSKQIAEHSRQIGQVTDLVLRLGRVVEEQGRRMDEQGRRMEEQDRMLDEKFALLAESQKRTDERLSALINVVERYFSNGHN